MTAVVIALFFMPMLLGMALIALRLLLGESGSMNLLTTRVTICMLTAAVLGVLAIEGIAKGRHLLPNRDADAPIAFIGAIVLFYGIASAVVMLGVLAVAVADTRAVLRRHSGPATRTDSP